MIEALYVNSKRTYSGIDIDFSRQVLGQPTIEDQSGRVWTPAGSGNLVVNDATMGKVMRFTGGQHYTTPLTKDLSFHTSDFVLDMTLKSADTVQNGFGGTGDYGDNGPVSGWGIGFNQFPSTYAQNFLMGPGTQYARLVVPLTNTLVWERHVLTKKGNNWKYDIYRNNVLAGTASIDYVVYQASPYFYLGCPSSSPGKYRWAGWLKSLKITLSS